MTTTLWWVKACQSKSWSLLVEDHEDIPLCVCLKLALLFDKTEFNV